MRSGGTWDYKKKYGREWEDSGNFNYGFVSAALGVPEQAALRFAGWYQMRSGTSRKEWGHWAFSVSGPYGDDPDDQEQIIRGYEYYRHKDLIDFLYASPSELGDRLRKELPFK
jgi:hypothetical protein